MSPQQQPILCYIAGPFRGPTPWDIAQNVRRAEEIGLVVARLGGMPVIPHANTAHFHGQLTDQFWLDGTKRLLEVCDVLVLGPGWRSSAGSIAELEHYKALGRAHLVFDLERCDEAFCLDHDRLEQLLRTGQLTEAQRQP